MSWFAPRWNGGDLDGKELQEFITRTNMKVGLEIPALPGEEDRTERLIDFAEDAGMDFVNLNELEFSEGNWDQLQKRGLECGTTSGAVKGSEEAALRRLGRKRAVSMHYCSSRFKDSVQLRRRIKRRRARVARTTDIITDEEPNDEWWKAQWMRSFIIYRKNSAFRITCSLKIWKKRGLRWLPGC